MGTVPTWCPFMPIGLTQAWLLPCTMIAASQALKLWTINLLPTWGRLMYQGWVTGEDQQGGSSGLLVTRPVRELLYGALPAGEVRPVLREGIGGGIEVGWRAVAQLLLVQCRQHNVVRSSV